MADERACLHCGQTKAQIKRDDTFCGIVSGYEYPELEAEWPKHRWADWTDKELERMGIKADALERYRRRPAMEFQWLPCDDLKRGHSFWEESDPEMRIEAGQCSGCGRRRSDVDASADGEQNDRG